MRLSFKKLLLVLLIAIPFSAILPFAALSVYDYVALERYREPVVELNKHQEAFNSTCAVDTKSSTASGVLLDTGFIITAKHVVDTNNNGKIDSKERNVEIKFSSIGPVHTGTIVYASRGHWRAPDVLDFAIVAIPNAPKSNIKLMSNEDYENLLLGSKIYAIGRSLGVDPAHITVGVRSTDHGEVIDRAALAVWFGNSGGGIYDDNTGQLIGVVNKVQIDRGHVVPDWTEYTPPDALRKELEAIGLINLVDLPQQIQEDSFLDLPLHYVLLTLAGLVVCYVFIRRRYLR